MLSGRQIPDQLLASDLDECGDALARELLIYATILRACMAVAMLLRFAVPVLVVGAVLLFEQRPNGGRFRLEIAILIGLCIVLLVAGLRLFAQYLRAALSLWGRCTSNLACPIPQRSECVMQLIGVGVVVALLCLITWIADWMNPQAQWLMPGGFYFPAAALCLMIFLHGAAAIAGLRTRAILERISLVPDVSLIEEPRNALPSGKIRSRTIGTAIQDE
jgi:hypothetical protein